MSTEYTFVPITNCVCGHTGCKVHGLEDCRINCNNRKCGMSTGPQPTMDAAIAAWERLIARERRKALGLKEVK